MPSRGRWSRSFRLGVVCVKFNRKGVATVGKGHGACAETPGRRDPTSPCRVQETLKHGEKSIAESQGASSRCTGKSATAAKAFATRGYKPQGIEESLASSACAISAINSCTDDCGCHPRTVRALVASPHRCTDRLGARGALRSARIASNQVRDSQRLSAQCLAPNA